MEISDSTRFVTCDHLMSDIAPDLTEALAELPRLRSWEIDASFKCPVIGWCLDINEQRQILKKEGIPVKGKTDFEVHGLVVESLETENHLSRRIDYSLNRKYRKEVKGLSTLAQGEFIRRWKASLQRGEVEGILWVAVTSADLSTEAKGDIFGDMHMQMHVRVKQIERERRRLDQERERSATLSTRVREASRTIRTLERENEKLAKDLNKTHHLCTVLERQKCEVERACSNPRDESILARLQEENEGLKDAGERLSERLLSSQRELKSLQKRHRKLLSRLDKQHQDEARLREDLKQMISSLSGPSSPCELHPSVHLCQSRILIVGGLPSMEPLYRRLIEENGGTFEYHDGQVNRGTKGLEQQVRRADLVLCPIDHNSHGASQVAKRLGKKYKKPVRMLANSSLSTISQMVQRL